MTEPLSNEFFQIGEDVIEDPFLRNMYQELRHQINTEASLYAGFPTIQQLLIDRACLIYVQMRQAEQVPGTVGPKAAVQMTREWLLLLQEIAKQATAKQDPEKLKAKIVDAIMVRVVDAMELEIPDPAMRRALTERLAEYLENVQL